MAGRTVLVTGSTNGIGRATATALAAQGARVGVVGRDPGRNADAAAEIRRTVRGAEVDTFAADLSAQAGVRALADDVLTRWDRLDVLVNNAGASYQQRALTVDGIERTFALNHLAPFLLTNLLLDRLRASAPARVVTVSSGAQSMGRLDMEDLQGERRFRGMRAYSQSKLANVLFTYELARRLEGTGVTATTLHPGVVRTGLGADDPPLMFRILGPVMRPFMKTPEQGAETSVYLASSPEVEGVTGTYFANKQPKRTHEISYDEAVAARLWEISAELVGLEAHDVRTEAGR